jgi:hypothetical protein
MAWGAIWHLRCNMEPDTYGRIVRLLARVNLASSRMLTLLTKRSAQPLVQEDTRIWSLESEDNEGEGGEEEEDLDLFA